MAWRVRSEGKSGEMDADQSEDQEMSSSLRSAEPNGNLKILTFTENAHEDFIAWLATFDNAEKIIDGLDRFPIDGDDDIGVVPIDSALFRHEGTAARLAPNDAKTAKPRAIRRAAGRDGYDDKSLVRLEYRDNPAIRPDHAPRLDQLWYDSADGASWDCKTDSRVFARRAGDGRIHSDQLGVAIQEGSSGVSLIQRGVDLDN